MVIAALAMLLAATAAPNDGDAARRAVTRGQRVPLETILADAERRHPGHVIDIELEDGVYEIEILLDDGRVAELEYAAKSGRLLESEIEAPDHDD